jgi:hypothetical protein
MAATPANVLAAIAGGATAVELCWVADESGAVLPTTPSVALDTTFKSLGYVTPDGGTVNTSIAQTDVPGFGTTSPIRTLITQETITIAFTALETNKITEALDTRQALSDITVTASVMSTTRGASRDALYSFILDAKDGTNLIRKVYPKVRVTNIGDTVVGYNGVIQHPYTLTAYADDSGNSEYRYTLVTGLV